ncbi:MAG: hypothetical protein WA254_17685 [Candidatus Sulfotelmatobacter sp.]
MNEKTHGNTWLDIALASALVILFVWLKGWSGLWQYRWTGVLMGLALGLYAQPGLQASYDVAKRYDIPRRLYLFGGAGFHRDGNGQPKAFFPQRQQRRWVLWHSGVRISRPMYICLPPAL